MIPNLPQAQLEITNESMQLTDIWFLFFSQLIIELQNTLSPNGFRVPVASSATIAALNNSGSLNTMIINTDTQELLVNLTGTYQVVQVV